MDRWKTISEVSGQKMEMQFDLKKMPGEPGPSYMVSIDGMFRGYIKKNGSGTFSPLLGADLSDDELKLINTELKKLIT
ncbi:hypothetical protein [Mucilaginibacter sp. CSA2-8R]|uniref:hypothetical protein n=1 Tax=Mucilaginibacter sp. CSA2-8R TaxID=3141542 RepID=UPI00315CCA91